MEQLIGLALIALIVALVLLGIRWLLRVVTVHDYERGVRFRRGKLAGLVDPGSHLIVRNLDEIRLIDGRPGFAVLEGQEMLTSDGVPLRISLAARYVVGDAVAAVIGDQDYQRAIHLHLQLGLRAAVASRTIDKLLVARSEIGPAVLASAAGPVSRIGVELLEVEVRDLMVPGELKRVLSGVVAARKEGEAALERARAETASLRSLANAGRMVEDNPGLLQLRVIQQLGQSPGATIMLGMPDGVAQHGGLPTAAARPSRRATRKDADEPG